MNEQFSRTQKIVGEEAVTRLQNARVAIFGLGGVGGHAAEAILRAGVGTVHLIDGDTVAPSNLNRQIVALHSTIGRNKAEVMRDRALNINPSADVFAYPMYFMPGEDFPLDFHDLDYVIDAVDMVPAKVALAVKARDAGVPIISSMGTGNKLDASMLTVGDLYETSVCPLARVMRREMRRAGIERLNVVYSTETPITPEQTDEPVAGIKRNPPGSTAFVPGAAGLMLAGKVFRDLVGR